MKFTVYQPLLTDAQVAEVNALGWNGSPMAKAYADVTNLFDEHRADALVREAASHGLYRKSFVVEAEDVTQTYAITNGMADGIVERIGRPKSGSVGDVVVDHGTGLAWLCAPVGWIELFDATKRAVTASAEALTAGKEIA